jgi:hypothetical protein
MSAGGGMATTIQGATRQTGDRSSQSHQQEAHGVLEVNRAGVKPEGDDRPIELNTELNMMESKIMTRTSPCSSVFYGSDAVRTRKCLAHLEKQGQAARIAAALFRSQKASSKATHYTGGIQRSNGEFQSCRSLSYQKKSRSLEELCSLLLVDSAGIAWGWGRDDETPHAPHVLYLDLSTGRVRFHSKERLAGPDYPGFRSLRALTRRRWLVCLRLLPPLQKGDQAIRRFPGGKQTTEVAAASLPRSSNKPHRPLYLLSLLSLLSPHPENRDMT